MGDSLYVSLLMLFFAIWFCFFAKELLPAYYDRNKVNFVSQGIFRIHMAGLSFNNANWRYVLTVFRIFTLGTAILYPMICYISFLIGGISLWDRVKYPGDSVPDKRIISRDLFCREKVRIAIGAAALSKTRDTGTPFRCLKNFPVSSLHKPHIESTVFTSVATGTRSLFP